MCAKVQGFNLVIEGGNKFWINEFHNKLFSLETEVLLKIADLRMYSVDNMECEIAGVRYVRPAIVLKIFKNRNLFLMTEDDLREVDLAVVKCVLQDRLRGFQRKYWEDKMVDYFTGLMMGLDRKTVERIVDVRIYMGGIFSKCVIAGFLDVENKCIKKLKFETLDNIDCFQVRNRVVEKIADLRSRRKELDTEEGCGFVN